MKLFLPYLTPLESFFENSYIAEYKGNFEISYFADYEENLWNFLYCRLRGEILKFPTLKTAKRYVDNFYHTDYLTYKMPELPLSDQYQICLANFVWKYFNANRLLRTKYMCMLKSWSLQRTKIDQLNTSNGFGKFKFMIKYSIEVSNPL